MENIFKDAYFGKFYKTRCGIKAVYLGKNTHYHELVVEETIGPCSYDSDGKLITPDIPDFDIVSDWKEEISKEKVLKIEARCLAEEVENGVINDNLSHSYPNDEQSWLQGYLVGFCRGYRKALEK